MANKKYVVIGGRVQSVNDGDIHYIDALQLCHLYNINPQEAHLVENSTPRPLALSRDLIWLYPRRDGNYCLPDGEREGEHEYRA